MKFKPFNYRDIMALDEELKALGLTNLPLEENTDILNSEFNMGGISYKNRFAIQPMEGCDGTREGAPDELTIRRYERFAASGAALIWAEAVAVVEKGRANPRQLFINDKTLEDFKRLNDKIRTISLKENGFEPVIIMQATHSGRYSKPDGTPAPVIAYNNPVFEGNNPIDSSRIITDDELFYLEEQYGKSAKMAQAAGFDGIDIKCCHRYLASELLSAYTREGSFGGSFENRTRLLRNGIKNAMASTSKEFIVTSRLNVYDGFDYPYGWGVKEGSGKEIDLSEPVKLIDILRNELGIKLINITIGNPYVNSFVNRPADCTAELVDENPLVGVDRMFGCVGHIQKSFPDLCVMGSGISYMREFIPNLAAGAIKEGMMSLCGVGREAFAYPDFYKDFLNDGKMQKDKTCITCGKCTELMRAGGVAGCVIKDSGVYMPLYKKYCK